jgi:hypothetical protein
MYGKEFPIFMAGCCVAALLSLSCAPKSVVVPQQTALGPSLCQVLDTWESHHLRQATLRGVFVTAFEASILFDPNCRERAVWVEFPTTIEPPVHGDVKRLNRLLSGRKGVLVEFEGVFYGPALNTDIDPRMPAPIRELLERAPRRYGHMDGYDYMIGLRKIVSVNPVPRGTKIY